MKRKLAVFLVLAMCVVGFAPPVSATTEFRDVETIQPRYTYIDAVGAKISKTYSQIRTFSILLMVTT